MSDESGRSDQPQEPHTDWWGDPISAEQQAELDTLAEQQRKWAEQPVEMRGHSPLASRSKDAPLTGANVFWLAQRALAGPEGDAAALAAAEKRLQDPIERFLLDLSALHLEGATLEWAHLERANLSEAHLEEATLSGAQMKGANLSEAHLEGARLWGAHLETLYVNAYDFLPAAKTSRTSGVDQCTSEDCMEYLSNHCAQGYISPSA